MSYIINRSQRRNWFQSCSLRISRTPFNQRFVLFLKCKLTFLQWCGTYIFTEPLAYEVVTEKDAAEMLDSITRPWYHQVRENIHNLFLAT